MNNEKTQRLTTVLLADAGPLADRDTFDRFFSQVSAERQRTIETMRFDEEKVLSLAGGVLLDGLLRLWGVPGHPAHDSCGKPFAPGEPELFLSLTHAYPYAAAVIASRPCGIDIENRSRDLSAIARRCYLPHEKDWAGSDPARLTDLWCRKECIIKFDRPRDLRRIDTFAVPEGYAFRSIPVPGFSCQVLVPEGDCRVLRVRFQDGRLRL